MTFRPHLPLIIDSNCVSGDLGAPPDSRLFYARHCGLFRPSTPGHVGKPDQTPSPSALAGCLGRVRNATDRPVTERDGPVPRNGVAIDNRRNASPHATSFLQFLLVIRRECQRNGRCRRTIRIAQHLASSVTWIRTISENPQSSVTAHASLRNLFEMGGGTAPVATAGKGNGYRDLETKRTKGARLSSGQPPGSMLDGQDPVPGCTPYDEHDRPSAVADGSVQSTPIVIKLGNDTSIAALWTSFVDEEVIAPSMGDGKTVGGRVDSCRRGCSVQEYARSKETVCGQIVADIGAVREGSASFTDPVGDHRGCHASTGGRLLPPGGVSTSPSTPRKGFEPKAPIPDATRKHFECSVVGDLNASAAGRRHDERPSTMTIRRQTPGGFTNHRHQS